MCDRNQFKDLNLDREQLESCLRQFCQSRQATPELVDNESSSKIIYKIIKAGIEPARIVFHLKTNGTTTIQVTEGKNKELNIEVAEYIRSHLCQNEISSLNMSISGINDSIIDLILDEIESIREKNDVIVESKQIDGGTLYQLKSSTFNDQLNISFYPSKNRLLIQGRPLSCYKIVAYALSTEIDTDTLAKILYKKDELDKVIVRTEISEDLLRIKLCKSYDKLPDLIRNLLVSSYCVKAASPHLLEYSMLTYCELKALEGVIKAKFLENGIVEIPNNIGELFNCTATPITLNTDILIKHTKLNGIRSSLEQAYTYYRQRRHSLFHMEGFTEATAKVNSLQEALNIGDKVYALIENLY